MMIYETVTEVGEGIWYKPYHIELVTITTHQPYRFQQQEIITTEYILRFRENLPNSLINHRKFTTPEARTAFIRAGFTEIHLQPPLNPPHPKQVPYFGDGLIGCRLVSITFILDYLQLMFEDDNGKPHYFNLYHFPTLVTTTGTYIATTWGYADVFRTFLNRKARFFEDYVDAGLWWEMEDNSHLELSLDTDTAFEVAEYSTSSEYMWQVWYAITP
jgi:hypothetical protein